jgi:integrase
LYISDKHLRNAKPRAKVYELSDGGGLSARVSPKGAITFQYRFRHAGRAQRMDLGTYPHVSLAEARATHFKAKQLLFQGVNPIALRKEQVRSERDAVTVEELVNEFAEKQLRRDRKRPEQAEQILQVNIVPFLGKVKIKDVRRRDVVSTLERIMRRGAPAMANRTASLTKQMFLFAIEHGHIDSNPCNEITRTSIGGYEAPRQIYLSYRDIWLLWTNLPKAPFSESFKIAIKILLATGLRRAELMNGEWDHVLLDKQLWIIPADLSKNGKQHVVQMTPLTLKLFTELKALAGGSRYLVPSPTWSGKENEDRPATPAALTRAIIRHRASLGVTALSPHVLRHTFSTQVSGLGVAPHVIEKLLNHSFTGMLAVYNHQHYFLERATALQKWSTRLLEISYAETEDQLPTEPNLMLDVASAAIQGESPSPSLNVA